jgi:hypothetical protein
MLAMAAAALWAAEARGEPPPIRVDYLAHEGCPAADVFLDEIHWRTLLARVAEPGEEALLVQARVTRRGVVSSGRLSLGEGKARTIEGPSCDEVVSALALITALAIAPAAFLMGMPFPSGLRRLEQRHSPSVRWAWSLNAASRASKSLTGMNLAPATSGSKSWRYLAWPVMERAPNVRP